MKPRDYATQRRDTACKAKPLGQFIVQQLHGGPSLPPPPVVGPEPRRRKKPRTHDNKHEAEVLHGCLRWLHDQGIFAWRNNSGTAWIGGQPVSFGFPGSADIIGLTPTGRFLAVECKSATGKQSDKQRKFEEKIKANGGVYLLVRSVEELEQAWVRVRAAT